MANLLFSSDLLDSFVYFVQGETLLEIAYKFNVPPHLIIYDNGLKKEPLEGEPVLIKRRKNVKTLVPESMPRGDEAEQLKRLNKCDVIYPFQIVIVEEPE